MGLIALEEHFSTPEGVELSSGEFPSPYGQAGWPVLSQRLLDLTEDRIKRMDSTGVELSILSMSNPGAQHITDPKKADEFARRTNDYVAGVVRDHSDRFRAFATVALQDPDLAAAELERAVNDLGLVGVLVNSFSDLADGSVIYYDDDAYRPFWETLSRLAVPMYLHPRTPPKVTTQALFEGHPWLNASSWGFSVQTATHALRLMTSGLFDALPDLQIIMGHLGEGLTFHADRIEHRMRKEWGPETPRLERTIEQYLTQNFWVTTSGVTDSRALRNALDVMSPNRVLFSTDYPMETMESIASWLDLADISDHERQLVGSGSARTLFKLGKQDPAASA